MKIIRFDSLRDAERYARQCRDEGEFDLFRGQLQLWPMVPTFLRLPNARRDKADARLGRFVRWVEGNSDVAAMLPTPQSRYAAAQHYGLPTTLLDVTRDPRIAGFFASHTSQASPPGTESCIYCFQSGRVRELMQSLHRKALKDGLSPGEIDLPAHFEIDVANLWRLQAQQGSFIDAPEWLAQEPDARLLEELFEATCLVFACSGTSPDLPEHLVYPTRKSALEIRLDEWFAQEASAEFQEEARAAGMTIIDGQSGEAMLRDMDFDSPGFKPEVGGLINSRLGEQEVSVFSAGSDVALDPSWTDPEVIGPWLADVDEQFDEAFTDERWQIATDDAADLDDLEDRCRKQVQALLALDPSVRRRTVGWHLLDGAQREIAAPSDEHEGFPDPERTTAGDWLALAWDGMRALPYDDDELALALGHIAAALVWVSRGKDPWVLEDALPLDLVMPTLFDPPVVISEMAFNWALRHDLPSLLSATSQHLARDPRLLLLAADRPAVLFDFTRWRRVFAVHVIPSQVVMNAQSGAVMAIYNPVLPVALRLH